MTNLHHTPSTTDITQNTAAMSCPVIGTTTDVLPPNHPEVDLSIDGQTVCIPSHFKHSLESFTSTYLTLT